MYSADVDFGDGHIRVNADGRSREWFDVLALKPKPPAICRGCGGAVTCVDGKVVISHFRHLAEPERCVFENETADHRRLKREIAAAVDALAGWVSEQEVRASGGDWIADVMAVSTEDGRRVAFEVQLSSQDREWAEERQRRRNTDGVECLWVVGPDGHGPATMSSHLRSRQESVVYEGHYAGGWGKEGPKVERRESELAGLVAKFLAEDLVFDRELDDPMPADQFSSYRSERERYKEKRKRDDEEWNRRRLAEDKERSEQVEREARRRVHRSEDGHYLKQLAVLGTVIDDLVAEHGRGLEVGEFTGSKYGEVIRSAEDLDDSNLGAMDGSWEYAYGLPIGKLGEPFAVVCPKPWLIEASKHGPTLGGLTVYCHSSDLSHMEQVYRGTPIVVDIDLQR